MRLLRSPGIASWSLCWRQYTRQRISIIQLRGVWHERHRLYWFIEMVGEVLHQCGQPVAWRKWSSSGALIPESARRSPELVSMVIKLSEIPGYQSRTDQGFWNLTYLTVLRLYPVFSRSDLAWIFLPDRGHHPRRSLKLYRDAELPTSNACPDSKLIMTYLGTPLRRSCGRPDRSGIEHFGNPLNLTRKPDRIPRTGGLHP